jgi:hypothetical protein
MMRRNFTIDTLLQLKDAGLVAASARAQVAGADQILDLGAGFVEGNIVIDVSAIEIDGGDEIYDLIVQLSSDSDFSDKTAVVERHRRRCRLPDRHPVRQRMEGHGVSLPVPLHRRGRRGRSHGHQLHGLSV